MIRTMELGNRMKRMLPFAGLAALLGVVALLCAGSVSYLEHERNLASVNLADVFALTNDERADEGVAKLQRNPLLDQAAQMKAQDMAAKGYYAHVSPEGVTPMHWVEKAGYKYLIIGENLVVNRTDAEQVVDAFMGSPGHRANIVRKDFTDIGVGVANGIYKGKNATFTVQIFAAPYPVAVTAKSAAAKPAVKPVQAPITKPDSKAAVAPIAVPRAPTTSATKTVPQEKPDAAATTSALAKGVAQLISPILSSFEGGTTSTTTVGPVTLPLSVSVPFADSAPIALAAVSQLDSEALPSQIGSSWSMQFKLAMSGWLARARSLFGS